MLHEHVAEGVHMIDDAYVNWFVVEDGGKLGVVDTGHPSSWRSLRQALTGTGAQTLLCGDGPVWVRGVGEAVERARAAGAS